MNQEYIDNIFNELKIENIKNKNKEEYDIHIKEYNKLKISIEDYNTSINDINKLKKKLKQKFENKEIDKYEYWQDLTKHKVRLNNIRCIKEEWEERVIICDNIINKKYYKDIIVKYGKSPIFIIIDNDVYNKLQRLYSGQGLYNLLYVDSYWNMRI